MIGVRRATLADAPAIGAIHVRAWQATYRGQMPDNYLDGLRPEDRARVWKRVLVHPEPGTAVLVAERDGAVVGFAATGPSRNAHGAGELYAINVDPAHVGQGIGRSLLERVVDYLTELGYAEAVLWVLPTNDNARRFYTIAGWSDDKAERTLDVLGAVVTEVRYRRPLTAPS